jgi:hypothetical protein
MWDWLSRAVNLASVFTLPSTIALALATYEDWHRHRNLRKWGVGALWFVVLCAYGIDVSDRLGVNIQRGGLIDGFDQTYANSVVVIDRKAFRNCTFSNVALQYSGESFLFDNVVVEGYTRFVTPNGRIFNTLQTLKGLHFLTPDCAASIKRMPPSSFAHE